MGFRFHKSIPFLSGSRLRMGKPGASTTVGVSGTNIHVSNCDARTTLGLTGTGISYTGKIDPSRRLMGSERRSKGTIWFITWLVIGAVLTWLVK